MYFSISSWEKTQIIRKFIRLDLFFLQDTAGSTANTEYIDYSMDLKGITQILGKIIKRSSEMAKIAIPVQEISENSEQSLYFCALIEKINFNPFVDIVGNNYEDHQP